MPPPSTAPDPTQPPEKTPNLRPKGKGFEARITIQKTGFSAYGLSEDLAVERLEEKVSAWERRQAKPKPEIQTFGSYWEKGYIPTLELRKPMLNQANSLKAHYATFWKQEIETITRPQLQAFITTKHKSGLSWWTVHGILKILRRFFSLAEEDEIITKSPARKVTLQRKPHMEQEVLSAVELQEVIWLALGKRSAVSIALCGLMGIGFEEIRGIEEKDVLKGRIINVRTNKTDYRPRRLPVPPQVWEIIKDAKFPLMAASNSSVLKGYELLGFDGPKINRGVLRHTCSTLLQEIGCPKEIRDLILGHAGRDMASHYSHSEMMRWKAEWLNKLADLVLPTGWENTWECSRSETA